MKVIVSAKRFLAANSRLYAEPIIWTIALVALFILNPQEGGTSLCIFRWIGFEHCPGCGLGHAINYALHLQWQQSIQEHWLGIPAVIILSYRIVQLFINIKPISNERQFNADDPRRGA